MPTKSQRNIIESIAAIGGILTTTSFIPQVLVLFKSTQAQISLIFLYVFLVGMFFWLAHAIILNYYRDANDAAYTGISQMIFNSITIILILIIIIKTKKHKKGQKLE
jgi:uncharacterized protein with PQ loop repeat